MYLNIKSIFNKLELDPASQVIFVSDFFVEELRGGAELTSEALIRSSPVQVFKLKSKDVSMSLLEQGRSKYWIFSNISMMDWKLIPTIISNLSYSTVQYDYLFCRYRSTVKHRMAEQTDCACDNSALGKLYSSFLYGSNSNFWMAEKQLAKYCSLFPFLSEKNNTILSSVFEDETLVKLKSLRTKFQSNKNNKYIILDSDSWIKNTPGCIEYANQNNLQYELVKNLSYDDMLEKLAQSKGLIFLPLDGDTCPRIVIEAKLVGGHVIVNENVQHIEEDWWNPIVEKE